MYVKLVLTYNYVLQTVFLIKLVGYVSNLAKIVQICHYLAIFDMIWTFPHAKKIYSVARTNQTSCFRLTQIVNYTMNKIFLNNLLESNNLPKLGIAVIWWTMHRLSNWEDGGSNPLLGNVYFWQKDDQIHKPANRRIQLTLRSQTAGCACE